MMMTPPEVARQAELYLTLNRHWTESELAAKLNGRELVDQLRWMKERIQEGRRRQPMALIGWIDEAIVELERPPTDQGGDLLF